MQPPDFGLLTSKTSAKKPYLYKALHPQVFCNSKRKQTDTSGLIGRKKVMDPWSVSLHFICQPETGRDQQI
jgi:hypothetical protein